MGMPVPAMPVRMTLGLAGAVVMIMRMGMVGIGMVVSVSHGINSSMTWDVPG